MLLLQHFSPSFSSSPLVLLFLCLWRKDVTFSFLFFSSRRLTMSSSFLCPPLLLHRSWLAPSPWCHCLLYQQTATSTDVLYFLYSKPFRVQIRTPVTWTIFKESPSGQGLAEQTCTPPSPTSLFTSLDREALHFPHQHSCPVVPLSSRELWWRILLMGPRLTCWGKLFLNPRLGSSTRLLPMLTSQLFLSTRDDLPLLFSCSFPRCSTLGRCCWSCLLIIHLTLHLSLSRGRHRWWQRPPEPGRSERSARLLSAATPSHLKAVTCLTVLTSRSVAKSL